MRWDEKPRAQRDAEWSYEWSEKSLKRLLPFVPIRQLINEHDYRTMACSSMHHMRKASGSVYEELERRFMASVFDGQKEFLRIVLKYMDEDRSGMNIMMILWDFTGEDPASEAYEQIPSTQLAAFSVAGCRQAWLDWGKRQRIYIR